MSRHHPWLPFTAALMCTALSACAQFSRDGGFGPVAESARRDLGADVAWPREDSERAKLKMRTAELLRRPLTPEDAVQIALLNNPGLQADFEFLGISEADLVQAGRLPNPRFDLLRASKAGQYDIEETLSFNVLALLTMPLQHAAETQRFAAAQQAAAAAVARLAVLTRRAYYDALAAEQSLSFARQVAEAATLGATLGERMQKAGNWNLLDQAHEQTFYLDAVRRLSEAEARQAAARQQLGSCLGLDGAEVANLRLAAPLPDLPAELEPLPDVERAILERRVDLKAARLQLDALARRLKLTRATRFVNVLDLGATRIKQGGRNEPYEPGFTLSFEIPIFDTGAARSRRAEALYRQAADRFAQSAIDARAEIHSSYALYRSRYEVARRQRDEVLPLRRAITEENLKRYNALQVSVFDLLADAREQAASVLDYVESLREFWNAKSQLDATILGVAQSRDTP